MTQPTIVEARGLHKSYRKGKLAVPALNDVDLDVREGEFMALMGPSGSGKSTLLNLLGGLDQPDGGSILIGSTNIARLSDAGLTDWRATNVGLVFQRYHLINVLSAAQNVELPLLLRKMDRVERRERVANALALVGMSNRASHLPSELSGGQEQRVSIARALVADAPILLCDEPTGNLDVDSGNEVLDILRTLCTRFGKTILMVTHDPRAAGLADRCVGLVDGCLAAQAVEKPQ